MCGANIGLYFASYEDFAEWRVVLRYSSNKEYPMGVGVGVAVHCIVCGESLSDCDWGLLKNAL